MRVNTVNTMSLQLWPHEYPEDCPPAEAPPADGMYYRIVKNDPPESSDFVPVYWGNQAQAKKAIKNGERTVCQTMGLSVYADIDYAIECARIFRKIGKSIARVTLGPSAGRAMETKGLPSHHTWWKCEGFDPTQHAQVVHSL